MHCITMVYHISSSLLHAFPTPDLVAFLLSNDADNAAFPHKIMQCRRRTPDKVVGAVAYAVMYTGDHKPLSHAVISPAVASGMRR